jgi:hypothetical protein
MLLGVGFSRLFCLWTVGKDPSPIWVALPRVPMILPNTLGSFSTTELPRLCPELLSWLRASRPRVKTRSEYVARLLVLQGAAEACYGLYGLDLFCAPKSAAARARKHAIKERVCRGAVMTGYVRECRYSIRGLAAQARDLTPSPRAQ